MSKQNLEHLEKFIATVISIESKIYLNKGIVYNKPTVAIGNKNTINNIIDCDVDIRSIVLSTNNHKINLELRNSIDPKTIMLL